MPTLVSAISAGSVLSASLRARIEEIYAWLGISAAWRSFVTAALGGVVLLLATAVWLSRPTIARCYNDRAMTAYREGRLADAEADLRRAVRLDPSYARAHYNLGSTCEEMLRTDDAKASYQLAFATGDVRAANNLGRLLLLEARPDDAVQVLLRAQDQVRERPATIAVETRYHVLKNLGWARLEQERYDEAHGHLAAAVGLLADEAAGHCLLGRLHGARGETELATSEWEACLKADPRKIEQDRWRGKAKAFLARLDAEEGS